METPDPADDFTEDLLEAHEQYAEELRAEMTSKAALLPRVKEWHVLVLEEEELEKAQNDPDRYKRRGGAMLREEKLRNRVTKLKPKVCRVFCITICILMCTGGRGNAAHDSSVGRGEWETVHGAG